MLNRTESREDLLTINGYRVEMNNLQFQDFVVVGGTGRNTTLIPNTDGGSGLQENFTDQTITFAPLAMTYRVDPSKNEWARLRQMIEDSFMSGIRHSMTVVKYNHGKEYMRIIYYKVLFNAETLPDLDKNGSGPYDVTMEAAHSGWEIL
jgi:hypothetical protein